MEKEALEQLRDAYNKVHEANMELHRGWLEHIVFTGHWWVALAFLVVPWALWLRFHNRESRARLLFAGVFIMCLASWLDFLGVVYGLWMYQLDVWHTIPSFLLWDFSGIPVAVMFFLQIKPGMHPLTKGVIFATFAAFIGEPVAIWLDFYEPVNWEHIYSFPVYILLYLLAHRVSRSTTFGHLDP